MNKKAFTLVELLVVMAIVAVLLGLGVIAMVAFRQTVAFQQAQNEFVAILRSSQNAARNATASKALIASGSSNVAAQVDGYALFFDTNNYSLNYCRVQAGFGSNQMDCSGVESANLKRSQYSEVSIYPAQVALCRGIFFKKLTGDIQGMVAQVAPTVDTGTCEIVISHLYNPYLTARVMINFDSNGINVGSTNGTF